MEEEPGFSRTVTRQYVVSGFSRTVILIFSRTRVRLTAFAKATAAWGEIRRWSIGTGGHDDDGRWTMDDR